MALKFLEGNDADQPNNYRLPSLRDYVKQQVEEGNASVFDTPLQVEHIELTKSKAYVKLTTEVCVAFIHVNDSLGQNITTLSKGLKGYGNAMCILPQKHGKRGFTVAVNDEVKVYWTQDGGATIAYPNSEVAPNEQKELTLKDFAIGETIDALKEDAEKQRKGRKNPPAR